MSTDPQQIIAGLTSIASLPAVAMKFSDAIKHPLTSNQDLENIIAEDSALATRVLKIANSAMYSFPSQIDSIAKALSIIGQNQVKDIVFACSVMSSFQNVPYGTLSMEQFWRHSLAVGVAARIIATLRREENVERYFLGGLLHDLGRLILLMERANMMGEVFENLGVSGGYLYKEEKRVFGFDHSLIGGLLIESWKFPASLVNAIQFHHNPSSAGEYIKSASIVHIADIIVHALRLGESGEENVPVLDENAWDFVGIDIDDVDYIFDQLDVQYTESVKYMLGE